MRLTVGGSGNESPLNRVEGRAELVVRIRIYATYKVVLLVCHDPRTRLVSVIPCGLVSKVGGLHGSVSVVAGVGLGVTVVKAATVVVVVTCDYPVLAFCLVVNSDSLGVVPAESHTGSDEGTVNLLVVDGYRCPVRYGDVVESTHCVAAESSARSLLQVVSARALVVDDGDPAISVGAELVLCLGVGCSGRRDANVQFLAVRLTHYLVERALVCLEQSTGGTVCRGARCSSLGVNVARTFRS